MSETFLKLREKHPKFFYKDYSYKLLTKEIQIEFNFSISPNIEFSPKVVIPWDGKTEINEALIFNLGMVESISYWKSTCSPEFIIECGQIENTGWWEDLFLNGLSEFLFKNKIDFKTENFVRFINKSFINKGKTLKPKKTELTKTELTKTELTKTGLTKGELILVGGGKDYSLTMQLLKDTEPNRAKKQAVFILNPTKSTTRTIKNAGFENQELIAKRTIDKKLLELNKQGYLNGHTPFSAYLAFLSTTVAELNGYNEVVLSNESSASEVNTDDYIIPVNHQYSKSYKFEKDFRDYISNFTNVSYYSFLRPVLEIQIAKMFSTFEKQILDFRSCNVGQKEDKWCRNCPKCAFVYLMLAPFTDKDVLDNIFGKDFIKKENIIEYISALIDENKVKPLECIGTREESLFALSKIKEQQTELPKELSALIKDTNSNSLLNFWDEENFLPSDKAEILKAALK